jgi:voltage-dependent calcium channel L type alpha-1D
MNNPIRSRLADFTQMPLFDNTILFLIIVSSILLAIDNPLNDPEGQLSKALSILDIIMTVLFVLEASIKIVVYGFILGKNTYMRDGWNILDFVIVIFSVASLAMGDSAGSLSKLKALRTLRVLRPLRMIRRLENMKLAINAMIRSIPSILNVLLICFFFFLLFGIVGVNYFKGAFFYCVLDDAPKIVDTITTK